MREKLENLQLENVIGFPEKFKLINNPGELYKQIGNSVCIPMVKEIAKQIKEQLL